MKDNFSSQSDNYAKYRPTYPLEFFDFLNSLLPSKMNAWDCGTGNGQIAFEIAKTFKHVEATDISSAQIKNAVTVDNVHYSIQAAESVNYDNDFFDLIIVGQAIHWFDFEKFYSEVKRTGKKNAIVCAVGYGRMKVNLEIDTIIDEFYTTIIGTYWDEERKFIDENYQTIPFPFKEISTPNFSQKYFWDLDHLIGYLNTWSAVKHYIQKNGSNPITPLEIELKKIWGNQKLNLYFPMLLRMGYVHQ